MYVCINTTQHSLTFTPHNVFSLFPQPLSSNASLHSFPYVSHSRPSSTSHLFTTPPFILLLPSPLLFSMLHSLPPTSSLLPPSSYVLPLLIPLIPSPPPSSPPPSRAPHLLPSYHLLTPPALLLSRPLLPPPAPSILAPKRGRIYIRYSHWQSPA